MDAFGDGEALFRSEITVDKRYMTDIFRDLDAQRKETHNSLCDVVLRAEGKVFPAHKCILSAASDYFGSMFRANRFSESASKEVELHLMSAEALEIIIDMFYMGTLKLNIDNVYATVAAADQLMLPEVKAFCDKFLTQIITSPQPRALKEALKIKRCADMYNLNELAIMAEKVISTHFETISSTEDFNTLSIQEVCDLLSSDHIQVTPEHVLWIAATSWLENNNTAAASEISSTDLVMQVIRFPLMDPKFLLSTVRPHPHMRSPKCQRYIQEAIEYQLLPEERSSRQTPRTKPRCTTDTTAIYCLAGASQFLCFLPHQDRWFSLQAPLQAPSPREASGREPMASTSDEAHHSENSAAQEEEFFYGLLAVSGYVFVKALGRSREQVVNFVLRRLQMYSVATNTWTECCLPQYTQFAILIECNGVLYSCSRVGIEAYSPERDQWKLMRSLPLSPCQFGVSDNKRIHLYNLEAGATETIHTDKQFQITKNQMMWLSRFDVLSLAKLNNHDVFLSLRTSTGIMRKIVNVRTNHWQDANKRICHGITPSTPKQGISYPHCLNSEDPWEIAFDRNKNEMYVLARWSAISDCPTAPASHSDDVQKTKTDAVLPFFKIDSSRTWRRQASLPEALITSKTSPGSSRQNLHVCISDGQTSMATSLP